MGYPRCGQLRTHQGKPLTAPAPQAEAGGSNKLFDVKVADMQTGITVSGNTITGTLKYLSGSNAITDVWGEGNFLCLKFPDADITNSMVKVGLEPSAGSGLVELDADKNGVFKITDKLHQKFVVQMTKDGETVVQRYDLSGLTCETE